ncbi:hypothetical protein [Yinghuangia soli]|uniref:Uncharacterized protein n=1 Tax=Yinghuangia soli TaxID=2908204 RepID=A0AA41Q0Z5_9ACTN|nr:hypothetical protein [Yinghuangia soli]MCF2528786.1 hypothetical protein [Yinghuangia soli]
MMYSLGALIGRPAGNSAGRYRDNAMVAVVVVSAMTQGWVAVYRRGWAFVVRRSGEGLPEDG